MKPRHQAILDLLEQKPTFTYQELVSTLGVSLMTIRRDIDALAAEGQLIKTLGGVQKSATNPFSLYESTLYSRLAEHTAEKRMIAEHALGLIEPGSTIYIDGSTTCLELAKLIARRLKGLTIITNSALVCMEIGKSAEHTVISLGGQFDLNSASFVGNVAEDQAAKYYVDMALVSTKGLVTHEGTFESSVPTFRIKELIARQCRRLVLMVDHSKFGQRALCRVLEISQVHTVVTDAKTPAHELEVLTQQGITVEIAGQPDMLESTSVAL
jgi:DeoR/GlpR family transcriptional regulator of sugar metabolism